MNGSKPVWLEKNRAHTLQLSPIMCFNYCAGQKTIKVPHAQNIELVVSNAQVTIGFAEHSHAIAAARIYVCMMCTYFKLVRPLSSYRPFFYTLFIGYEIRDCIKFNDKQKN